MTGGIASVISDNKVCAVETFAFGIDEVSVHVRGGREAVGGVNSRATQPSLPGLLAIGVAVQDSDGCVAGWCIGSTRRHGFVHQNSEAVIVGDETSSYMLSISHNVFDQPKQVK